MITIKELMNKIKWDTRENPQQYIFYYYDRVENKLKELKWDDIIRFDGLFISVSKDGKQSYIPFHRIKKVVKENECVWRRSV